jgi:hypothetical protein
VELKRVLIFSCVHQEVAQYRLALFLPTAECRGAAV